MKFHVADWIVLKWSNKTFFITSFTTITNTTIIAVQRLSWQLSVPDKILWLALRREPVNLF